ncbi:MAG TPA: protein kinase, partial [Kofleriaceae bacterium]|nr:protein kinase [Kofleriaceae bacterium]
MLGTTLGQYRITGTLGVGGMGVVYKAEHTLLGRAAAVKILLPEFSGNQEVVTRFFNEARAAAAIRHPGIVEIYDFGWHTDGSAYLVMEYLRGESLAARIKHGGIAAGSAMIIARQIAGALAVAHRSGIVHRDLKPENLFLEPDVDVAGGERVKLLDFGIAKLAADSDQHRMTRPGAVLGTPTYMAPEQCRGEPVDHRADLYSLGCIMFELCTGRPPFVGRGMQEVFVAHLEDTAPAMSSLVRGIPRGLDLLVQQLLVKDHAARTQSAEAVVRAIDDATGGAFRSTMISVVGQEVGPKLRPSSTTLSEASGMQPAPPGARHARLLGAGVAVIAVALAAIAFGVVRGTVRRGAVATEAPNEAPNEAPSAPRAGRAPSPRAPEQAAPPLQAPRVAVAPTQDQASAPPALPKTGAAEVATVASPATSAAKRHAPASGHSLRTAQPAPVSPPPAVLAGAMPTPPASPQAIAPASPQAI